MKTDKEWMLLTGGTGFLGRHIIKDCLKKQRNLIVLVRDISKAEKLGIVNSDSCRIIDINEISFKSIFEDYKIKIIFNAATSYGYDGDNFVDAVETNIVFPLKLAELGALHCVDRFINIDTFYNDNYSYLQNYALSKRQFREWLEKFNFNMTIVNIVACHLYGPMDSNKKFIPSMIKKLLIGEKNIPLTPGNQYRYFLYIEDFVDLCSTIIEHSFNKRFLTIHAVSNELISIKQIVTILKELTNRSDCHLDFGALSYRKNEIMSMLYCIPNNYNNLDWIQKHTIRDGLTKTVMWHQTNIEN